MSKSYLKKSGNKYRKIIREIVADLNIEELIELWDFHRKLESDDIHEHALNVGIANGLLEIIAEEFVRKSKGRGNRAKYAGLVRLGMALESGNLGSLSKVLRSQPNNRSVSDEKIKNVMDECGDNKTKAAKKLEISRRQLYRRLKDL